MHSYLHSRSECKDCGAPKATWEKRCRECQSVRDAAEKGVILHLAKSSPGPAITDGGSKIYLYAIAVIADKKGPVKFGVSINPHKRLVEVQTGCPFQLTILAYLEGSRVMEGLVHQYLQSSRMHGEWFRRDEETEFIIELIRIGNRNGLLDVIRGRRRKARVA